MSENKLKASVLTLQAMYRAEMEVKNQLIGELENSIGREVEITEELENYKSTLSDLIFDIFNNTEKDELVDAARIINKKLDLGISEETTD